MLNNVKFQRKKIMLNFFPRREMLKIVKEMLINVK